MALIKGGTQPLHTFSQASSILTAALDDLAGEPLFPVFIGNGLSEPNLVALDASGAAVVVDLIERLESTSLLGALSHAGAVSRMSRGELAARFPGGYGEFQHELADYLAAVPYRRPQTKGAGARLIVVCEQAAAEVWDAAHFLNRPELPISIVQAKTIQTVDGQAFVDISPLATTAPPPDTSPPPDIAAHAGTLSPAASVALSPAPTHLRAVPTNVAPEFEPVPAAATSFHLPSRAELRRQHTGGTMLTPQPVTLQPGTPQPSAENSALVNQTPENQGPENQASVSIVQRKSIAERRATQTQLAAKPLLSRAELRAQRAAAAKTSTLAEVEITGVFAQGTMPSDHLSWDTTTLPVIARPRRSHRS